MLLSDPEDSLEPLLVSVLKYQVITKGEISDKPNKTHCFVLHFPISPFYTVFLGQCGGGSSFDGCLTCSPSILSACSGNGIDLSIVTGVLIQVLDLQLATSNGYLIPHYSLVTDNLVETKDRQNKNH